MQKFDFLVIYAHTHKTKLIFFCYCHGHHQFDGQTKGKRKRNAGYTGPNQKLLSIPLLYTSPTIFFGATSKLYWLLTGGWGRFWAIVNVQNIVQKQCRSPNFSEIFQLTQLKPYCNKTLLISYFLLFPIFFKSHPVT